MLDITNPFTEPAHKPADTKAARTRETLRLMPPGVKYLLMKIPKDANLENENPQILNFLRNHNLLRKDHPRLNEQGRHIHHRVNRRQQGFD